MSQEADTGIIDPGVNEYYADGREIVIDEYGVVHTTLYVSRGAEKWAVVRFHMPERKWMEGTKRAFNTFCTCMGLH